jgi:hypothetical protein
MPELNRVFSTQGQRPEGSYGKIQPVGQNLRDYSTRHKKMHQEKH